MAALKGRVSQAAIAAATSGGVNVSAEATQAAALTAYQNYVPFAEVSEIAVLAAKQTSAANTAVESSQLAAEVVRTADGLNAIPQASQLPVLVVYRTGPLERFDQRAWTFDFDGHTFYVLHLGQIGTFVYDLLTGEWAQWDTDGLGGLWNMEYGREWNGQIVAGDNQNPLLWFFDPDTSLDDGYKAITRVVTGGFPAVGRQRVKVSAVRLNVSLQGPSAGDADPTISLRFSDDETQNWVGPYTVALRDAGNQKVEWRSLGSFTRPGRVFEITDLGGLQRIDYADISFPGDEE